jgi:signal transduction histidine kinase
MRCGIVTIDVERRVQMVNRVAREVLELPEVTAGVSMSEALAGHPRLIRALDDAFAMSSLPNRAEIELGNGAGKTIGFTLSLVRDPSGELVGAAMFFKDLTQIEHKEEQERLKDRLAALGQMAASLAHEIRNPLASIDVTCSLLKRRLADDAKGCELLGKIVAEVRRLNSTVCSSLEFVRPLPLSLEPERLVPLLDEAIAVAVGRRGNPGVVIERKFGRDVPAFLMDRALLRQVFQNLILNALEAVGDQGAVTVSTEVLDAPSETTIPYRPAGPLSGDGWPRVEQFVVVRVSDTGSGIGACDIDRIFYPLFTTKKQGSGIGLAVVRKIVNAHRGLIDVESVPGDGAEFSVRLPMAQPVAEVRGR